MPSQPNLFEDYSKFPVPEAYPKGDFAPKHAAFEKCGEVHTGTTNKKTVFVDMRIGECQCNDGYAFKYDQKRGKWYDNKYCIHKMRLLSSIVTDANPNDRPALDRAYLLALGTRYNRYETISAFHKELRRGDFEKAWFWGLIVSTQRRIRGVFQYLLNIVYEETRDHDLALYLLKLRSGEGFHDLPHMAKAIAWFCSSIKKWEMPGRYDIFNAEMEGYNLLVKKYGKEVAGHGNVITRSDRKLMFKRMSDGYTSDDPVIFQYGLKGLQKLEYGGGEQKLYDHRFDIYERLYDLASDKPDYHPVWSVIGVVNTRIEANYGIGYHELNAIGDALMGEPLHGSLQPLRMKALRSRPTPPIPIGQWPEIPLYAHDNHSYRGKALMRRYPEQLKPGVPQTDLDFRWCGAYYGVCYRMLAFKQHGDIHEWHKVKWPSRLFKIVEKLWY